MRFSKSNVAVVAILAIAEMESIALVTGHDGQLFAGAIAAIGAIGGAYWGSKA